MTSRRERIEPNKGDKRYARRDERGRFTSRQTDVGQSAASDQRKDAKAIAKSGRGDRGDRR